MSNQTVISVENLGKAYQINHQVERQRYVALRDVVANKFKELLRPKRRDSEKSGSREDFRALKNVHFELKQGDVVGILGRNGAGKSTLLKILSRITEPSEGRVRIKGRIASLLEVGTGFHPELTGRENIFLNGAILGMSRAEIKSKFDEIVAFAEVEKFLDTAVKFYSSGMYVRLAFAVAAHLEPEILIVDEVLAVGDAEFQKKCLGRMGAIARDGRTVIFVSHNTAAVVSLCQRVFILDHGNLVADGPAAPTANKYIELCQAKSRETARAEVVITDGMRSGSPKTLRITKVRVSNSAGEITCDLKPNEPFTVQLTFEALANVDFVCFGVGITTLDGNRILTTHHVDTGAEPISVSPGFYTISSVVEAPLKPGSYTLDVGAVEKGASGGRLDYAPAVTSLEIAGFSKNDGFLEIQHRWGSVAAVR